MTTPEDKNKYVALDGVLQKINSNYISLQEEDCKRNREIVLQLLELLIPKMKETDNLFGEMYTRVFYGGSFYDRLRVGQPDEFDLDLLLTLPNTIKVDRKLANIPGYLTMQLDLTDLHKQVELNKRYKGFKEKLLDEKNYLDTEKVRRWMGGLLIRSLNNFPSNNFNYTLNIKQRTLYVKKPHEKGPAYKLEVNVGGTAIKLDIDLVPCFEFTTKYWPPSPNKGIPAGCNKSNFFIVPKPIKNTQLPVNKRFWRLSFQEQERHILNDKKFLKPSIKLLKKLRDTRHPNIIESYYIKTVGLWEADEKEELWGSSLSYAFMRLLNTYADMLEKGSIPYYWNKKNNLIGHIPSETKLEIARNLKRKIKEVDRHLVDDPMKIAKYILTSDEYEKINICTPQGSIINQQLEEVTTTNSKCSIL